jgi:hypothetical protein
MGSLWGRDTRGQRQAVEAHVIGCPGSAVVEQQLDVNLLMCNDFNESTAEAQMKGWLSSHVNLANRTLVHIIICVRLISPRLE